MSGIMKYIKSRGKCYIDLQKELGNASLEVIDIEIEGFTHNRMVVRHQRKLEISLV